MNIFATHEDPRRCALALDDKRVGKMLMEANLMLSRALQRHGVGLGYGPGLAVAGQGYRGHPCTLWVGACRGNFTWLCEHAYALSDVFTMAYGKRHASAERTPYLAGLRHCLPAGDLLPFVNCARNDRYDMTEIDDTVMAYRAYLSARWHSDARVVTWTNREPPSWHTWDPVFG